MKSVTARKDSSWLRWNVGAFVPFTGGAQLQFTFLLDSQVISNRLWFSNDLGIPGVPELTGLAQGAYTWHTTNILPSLSSDLTLQIVVATDWSVQFPLTQGFAGPPINGGVAGESSSANVAVVVPFRWPLNRPHLKRNKNYVPGVPEAEITLNTPSASIRDVLWDAYVSLIDDCRLWFPAFTWRWVALSGISGGTPRSEAVVGEVIGPAAKDQIILGQRRKRLPLS
ncbi:MAG TPA: hypothetical protein VKG87_13110 [Terriglobales bacterium]|nr:hypothetical protein [Terriglobales bacterium]